MKKRVAYFSDGSIIEHFGSRRAFKRAVSYWRHNVAPGAVVFRLSSWGYVPAVSVSGDL